MSTTATREIQGTQVPVAGTYTIDPSHTTVEFVARHLMITKVRGRFTDFEGVVEIADVPEQSRAEVTIQAASIDTADASRDEHVRSEEFLDAERHPTLTFRSTSVERGKGDAWKLHGELTVRGVTRPVVLDVEFEGTQTDPWGGERIGFTAATEVDREDWGLTWNQVLETGGVLVGRKIRIELGVQAVRQTS